MKKIFWGAAALAAMATPAMAETHGSVDLTYEDTSYDSGSDFNAVSIGGAVATNIGGGWNVQFDGRTNNQDWDGSSSADSLSYAAVHAFARNDSYAIGGYGGLVSYYDDSIVAFGVEGQKYLSNATLSAAVSYGDADSNSDYSAWRGNVGGKYFFSENFALGGELGYTSFDQASSTDYDGWDLGANLEYQISGSPVSLFGGYTYTDMERSTGSSYNMDTLQAGVKIDLGGDTVQSRENKGASLSGASSFFNQWVRW